MTETNCHMTVDPSLKTYFTCVVSNCKIPVMFTQQKIIEIINKELGIYWASRQSLYARVCVEAFTYYLQNWPKWNDAINSEHKTVFFKCLVRYLRNKFWNLKEKEQCFLQKRIITVPQFDIKNNINLSNPGDMHIVPENVSKKETAPCCLKVNIPEGLWYNTNIKLETYGTHLVYLKLSKAPRHTCDYKFEELLNYPFVHMEFTLPGLITFSRSTPFKIKRFLQTMSDPVSTDVDHIISIEESDQNSPHKVYTFALMTALFKALKQSLTKYALLENLRLQIVALCDAFLQDIFETNLKKGSVCEGSTVRYNIARSNYFVNSDLKTQNTLYEKLIFRTVITPVISYNLISCDVTHVNGTEKAGVVTFDYFNMIDNDPEKKKYFLHNIKNSLKYKCTLCDLNLSLAELKIHILDVHYFDTQFTCALCSMKTPIRTMLMKRWNHDCPDPD